MKDYDTKYCIQCGALATMWCGHVHKNTKLNPMEITAGWCEKHKRMNRFEGNAKCTNTGCYGKWFKKYGMVEA